MTRPPALLAVLAVLACAALATGAGPGKPGDPVVSVAVVTAEKGWPHAPTDWEMQEIGDRVALEQPSPDAWPALTSVKCRFGKPIGRAVCGVVTVAPGMKPWRYRVNVRIGRYGWVKATRARR